MLDPRGAWDDLTRYQVDNAVTLFGITLENALRETVEVTTYSAKGPRTTHKPKYTLAELLEENFKFSSPQPAKPVNSWQVLQQLASNPRSGVKAWRYVGPPPKEV